MSTLDKARQSLQSAARGDWRIVEATEAIARAVFHDETEKAEAERRQKLDDIKRSIGVPVFADPATSPTDTGAGDDAGGDRGDNKLRPWDGLPAPDAGEDR